MRSGAQRQPVCVHIGQTCGPHTCCWERATPGGSKTCEKEPTEPLPPPWVKLRASGLPSGLRLKLCAGLRPASGLLEGDRLGLRGTGSPSSSRIVRRPSEVTGQWAVRGLAGCTHFLGLSAKGSAGVAGLTLEASGS